MQKNKATLIEPFNKHYDKLIKQLEPSKELREKFENTSLSLRRSFVVYSFDAVAMNKILRGISLGKAGAVETFFTNIDKSRSYIPKKDSLRRHIEVITNAIDKSALKEDLVMYRGINGNLYSDMKVGETISDKGSWSATLNPHHTLRFMFGETAGTKKQEDHCIIKINAKRGDKAIPIEATYTEKSDGLKVNEMILQKGGQYKIKNISHQELIKGVKTKIIEVDII